MQLSPRAPGLQPVPSDTGYQGLNDVLKSPWLMAWCPIMILLRGHRSSGARLGGAVDGLDSPPAPPHFVRRFEEYLQEAA